MKKQLFLHLSPRTRKLILSSGAIGNFLDAFDLTLCMFLAQTIATEFFPTQHFTHNLINIFYIFLIGYLSRPFGSIILGVLSDYFGRKKILVISIVLVAISTTIIGIIPSYQAIGPLSILLFFLCRITQNIFAGGEYTSSISYLIENGETTQKGYFGSWAALGNNAGMLLASFATFILMILIDLKFIPFWSWRVLFLVSILGMVVGLWVRLSIPESITFVFSNNQIAKNKLTILKESLQFIFSSASLSSSICAITWLGVCITYATYIYSPIHMTTINHLSKHQAFGINTISMVIMILLIPFFGILSDHFNKTTILKITNASFLFISIPYYWYLSYGSFIQILLMQILITIPAACFFCVAPTVIADSFPQKIRCTSFSLLYQTVSSLAAGLTPFIAFSFIHWTHISYSPAYLIFISALLSLFCLLFMSKKYSEQKNNMTQLILTNKWEN